MEKKNGEIRIWDLIRDGLRIQEVDGGGIQFEEVSWWDRSREIKWQDLYPEEADDYLDLDTLQDRLPEGMRDSYNDFIFIFDSRRQHHIRLQNAIRWLGHTDEITCLKVVGDVLFTFSVDGTVKKWNISTQECLQTIQLGVGLTNMQILEPYIFGIEDRDPYKTLYQFNFLGECLYQIDLPNHCKQIKIEGSLLFCFFREEKLKAGENGPSHYVRDNSIAVYNCYTRELINSFPIQTSNQFQIAGKTLYLLEDKELITWDFSNI